MTPFVAFGLLAVYVASVRLLRRGMLLPELPAGKAEVPVGRMGSDSAVGWRTSQISNFLIMIGRCLVVLEIWHAQGGNDESPAIIGNGNSARSDNRCKHPRAPSPQASRSRAECGAAASRPSGRRIYEDVEGHDREIGTAEARR